eukprot:tig00000269_g23756.t1
MDYCQACPMNFYSSAEASLACTACSETQFCPVATVVEDKVEKAKTGKRGPKGELKTGKNAPGASEQGRGHISGPQVSWLNPGAAGVDYDSDADPDPQVDPLAGRSVSGSFFTAFSIAFTFVAVAFVFVQFAIANYQIMQSLNPGASPSAEQISGRFAVSAVFSGYRGPCVAAAANASSGPGSALADVAVDGAGFAGAVSVKAQREDDGLSCKLVSSNNVTVAFALRSRLALSFGAKFDVQFVSANGTIATSSPERVFRGSHPVVLPVSLIGTHFSSEEDGAPRFTIAVASADNRPAERDTASFTLCPAGRPLERCDEERVTFVAAFEVAQIYYLVRRTQKATILDMLANLASLSGAAMGTVAQIFLVYVFSKKFLQKRHGLKAVETLSDLDETEMEGVVAVPPPLAPAAGSGRPPGPPPGLTPDSDGDARKAGSQRERASPGPPPPPPPPPPAPERARSRSAPRGGARKPDPPPLVPSSATAAL